MQTHLWTPTERRIRRATLRETVKVSPVFTPTDADGGTFFAVQDMPGPFTPTSIAGCVLWLRADTGITLNSTTVSAWADQSGVGDSNRNVSQATPAKQPTYTASDAAYNNQSTMTFAGGSTQLLASAGAWSDATISKFTIFIVGNSANGAGRAFCSGITAGWYLVGNSTTAWLINNGSTLQDVVAPTGAKLVLRSEWNTDGAGNGTISVSQATHGASGIAGTASNLGADGGFGVGGSTGNAEWLTGKVAEVIAYNSVLSTANVALVQNYISSRYTITIGP